jgi:isopentenyl-diphosphate delta-isomerase
MTNIKSGNALHRAFSVFLFNDRGELLLQQRSQEKITFPEYWTNTCCSHPLFNLPEEKDGVEGAKSAAIRKLNHELGIVGIEADDLTFLTKILYKAESDTVWGEHEVDYILFAKKSVLLDNTNANEVMNHRYVSKEEMLELIKKSQRGEVKLTPWFALICDSFLMKWWDRLDKLEECIDSDIHKMY